MRIRFTIPMDCPSVGNHESFPKSVSENMLSSFPRNHNIANVFYKAGFVETWGRGFKKIKEEFERVNLTLPIVEENCGGVMVTIQRKTMDEVIAERSGNDGEFAGVNVGNFVGNTTHCRAGFGGIAESRDNKT